MKRKLKENDNSGKNLVALVNALIEAEKVIGKISEEEKASNAIKIENTYF